MDFDNRYNIPANMAGADKFWTNGYLYITWIDLVTGIVGLIGVFLISTSQFDLVTKIGLIVLCFSLTIFFMLFKLYDLNIYDLLFQLVLYLVRPKIWIWRHNNDFKTEGKVY